MIKPLVLHYLFFYIFYLLMYLLIFLLCLFCLSVFFLLCCYLDFFELYQEFSDLLIGVLYVQAIQK